MELLKRGKVRDMFINRNESDYLLVYHSDRLSSFDSNICNIDGKGNLLMLLSIWWMNNTRYIVDNHYINHYKNYMLVKKCKVIPIEFVVRGYITGSTNTSLWTHYKNGTRNYCGVEFPDGLVKNQELRTPVLTPTTKSDEHDELISCEEIVSRNILTQGQLDYVKSKALQLFSYGQTVAYNKGLLLVDTKYEFGFDQDNNIILIDEIHTGDSSRYWRKDTYDELFNSGKEPQKIDKDAVRDYIKTVCEDPYNDPLPSPEDIPSEVKDNVRDGYKYLYENICESSIHDFVQGDLGSEDHYNVDMLYDSLLDRQRVVILSGSLSDDFHVRKLQDFLDDFNIINTSYVVSAHKNTKKLLDVLDEHNKLENKRLIFVTVAGRSNALSGVVACNTRYPTLACPPFKDKDDMMVNINSTLQCPSNTPVLTALEPQNIALSCFRILSL